MYLEEISYKPPRRMENDLVSEKCLWLPKSLSCHIYSKDFLVFKFTITDSIIGFLMCSHLLASVPNFVSNFSQFSQNKC